MPKLVPPFCWCLSFDLSLSFSSSHNLEVSGIFLFTVHSCGNSQTKVKTAFVVSYYRMFTGVSGMQFCTLVLVACIYCQKYATLRFSCTPVFLCLGKSVYQERHTRTSQSVIECPAQQPSQAHHSSSAFSLPRGI